MALIKCEHCGNDVSDRAKVCPSCGAELIPPEVEEKKTPVLCEECGTEIPEGATECPKCGCPVSEETTGKQEVEPQKVELSKVSIQGPKKKTLAMIGIALAAIAAIVVIAMMISKSNAQKKHEELLSTYQYNLNQACDLMLSSAAEAESAGNLIKKVWYNAIHDDYDSETYQYTKNTTDFNQALSNLFSDSEFSAKVAKIEQDRDTVAEYMKKLVNPPEEYTEAYAAIKQFYDAYYTLSECAVNPSGSLNTYSSTFNDADTDTVKYYKAMDLYLN